MKKVVLIDDDYGIREGIKTLISAWSKDSKNKVSKEGEGHQEKYEVYSSENGVEGLGYVYLTNPDVVIIDTTLPKYSGRELIEYLKSNKSLIEKGTKVVVLTEEDPKLDKPSNLLELPSNFRVISKKDPIFEEKLKKALDIFGVELGTLERIVNSLIRIGNQNDILLRKITRSNLLLKLPQYILWFIYQVEMSIILFSLRLYKGRTKDSNIKQEKKDLTQFRVRYYPTLVTVITSLLFIILQVALFTTGGLVVLNTRVESIFAIGESSQTLTFNTETQSNYTYNEEQVSFTTEGVSLELTQLTEGTPAQEGQEEVVDPETGEIIQEAQPAQEEIPASYEYKIEGEGIITTTNPIEYTELLGFIETRTTVNTLGEEVTDSTAIEATSIHYQISNDSNTWYYYDTTNNEEGNPIGWEEGGLVLTETNTATELNNNITTFTEEDSTGNLYIKVYLSSTDTQYSPSLQSITLQTDKGIITPITTQEEIVVPNAPDPGLSEYYVDGVAGDDDNSGTSSLPLQTIQAAADVADAGDTIYVKGGITYNDYNTCSGTNAVVCVTISGTSGNPITYTAWPGTGTPIINATVVNGGLDIENVDYVIINGFKFEDALLGAVFISGSTEVIFKNNLIDLTGDGGGGVNLGASTNVKFYNNTVITPNNLALALSTSSGLDVRNNIVANSSIGIFVNSSTGMFDYNLVANNGTDYMGISAGANDVNSDPLFTDVVNEDFTLQSTSPAIDAGADLSGIVDTDIRGLSRSNAAGHDIGAYEDGNLYVAGDTGDDTTGDGSAGNPWQTIAKAASIADAGDTVNVKGGLTYIVDNVTTANTGTTSYYITYTAWVDTGIPVLTSVGAGGDIFNVVKKNHRIEGFYFDGADIKCIDLAVQSDIVNNIFNDCAQFAVDFGTFGPSNFINNMVNNSSWIDGAVGVSSSNPGVEIKNNIFTNNTYAALSIEDPSVTSIQNNIFYNNLTSCDGCTLDSTNILSQDPQFIDAAGGDYRLMGSSPGIDAGQNVTSVVTTDIQGRSRLLEGGVDIGAYENQTQYYVAGDTGSDSNDGTELAPFLTVAKASEEALAGNTVNIKGGLEYTESDIDTTNAGTTEADILYRSWPGTGTAKLIAGPGADVFNIVKEHTSFDSLHFTSAGIKCIDGMYSGTITNSIFDNCNTFAVLGLSGDIEFVNNIVYSTNTIDGGLINLGSNMTIKNNIFMDNPYAVWVVGAGTTTFENNLFFDNSSDCRDCTVSDSDIVGEDPQFIDAPGGDFRLMGNSPAIDTGTDTTTTILTDILGNPRLIEDGVDIGAYENITEYYVAGDTGNDNNLGIESTPFKTIQAAADVVLPGGSVNVKGGLNYSDNQACNALSGETSVVCIDVSGTSTNQIVFRNWRGTGIPVIDIKGQVGHGFGTKGFAANSYITIEGFRLTNSTSISMGNNPGLIYFPGFGGIQGIKIKNNIIDAKNTEYSGIRFMGVISDVEILNNTIYGGGYNGIYLWSAAGSSTDINISNNIIVGNSQAGIAAAGGSVTTSLKHNLIWNNTGGDYVDVDAGLNDIVGQDPLFVDAAGGDFTLQSTSPALNSGDDSVLDVVSTDILGLARPQGPGIDIGAYEYADNEIAEVVITRIGTIENIVNITPVLYYYTEEEMEVEGRGEVGATVYFENKTTGEVFTSIVDEEGTFTITLSNERGTNEYEYYQIDTYDNKSITKELTLVIGIENFPDWLREEDQDNQDGEGSIQEQTEDESVEDLLVETEEEDNETIEALRASIPIVTVAAISLITTLGWALIAGEGRVTAAITNVGVLLGVVTRKKRKYWGIIYDERNGKELPFVIVRLYRNQQTEEAITKNKPIKQTVTDEGGRYSFTVRTTEETKEEEYRIEVEATGYRTEEREIKLMWDKEIMEDIAMRREEEGKQTLLERIQTLKYKYKEIKEITGYMLLSLMVVGLGYTIYITVDNPVVINMILLLVYIILIVIDITMLIIGRRRVIGKVVNKETKEPIKNVVVRIYDSKDNQIGIEVTNERGEMRLRKTKGSYTIIVRKEGYEQLEKEIEITEGGYLKEDINLTKEETIKKGE